jgi:hypothetical protein
MPDALAACAGIQALLGDTAQAAQTFERAVAAAHEVDRTAAALAAIAAEQASAGYLDAEQTASTLQGAGGSLAGPDEVDAGTAFGGLALGYARAGRFADAVTTLQRISQYCSRNRCA